MKLSLLVSILVLSTILYEAQGIRLGKVSLSTGNIHGQIQKEGTLMGSITANSGGAGKSTVSCKDDDNYSGGILNRKLMSKPPSSTTTTTTTSSSKNHANDANKEGHAKPSSNGHNIDGKDEARLSVSPSPFTKYREVTRPEEYPDIIDLAGMDYSPAKKKPPIHN